MPSVTSSRLEGYIPIIGMLKSYSPKWFLTDTFAGISVCLIMIPSVLAYSELAGLTPVHGLYAALAGMIAYAMFASSHQVIAGPDAALSLLVASAVAPWAGGDPAKAAVLASMTALLGGGLMLLACWLKAGVIADFLSKPVLIGYLTGAALILISTQLGKLFGIPSVEHDFFPLLAEISRRINEAHVLTLILGVVFVVILEVLRRFAPRIPGALAIFVVALVSSLVFHLDARGVKVVGEVPQGLPTFSFPKVSLQLVRELFPAAVGIVMLTFPEAVLLARAFAAKNRYDIRPNQELFALGVANLATGLFQGFSVGASQSRTTVNDSTGGKTQVVSLMAAGALTIFLLFLTQLLRLLPTVALASILIFAGIGLIEIHEYRRLFSRSRRGFWVALAVTAGVLIVGVVPGILVGVVASLIYVLARLARPMDVVLSEVPGTGRFHDLGDTDQSETIPGLIAYRIYSPLFFANAEYFVQRARQLIAESSHPVRCFLIDLQAVWEIDFTAADALTRLSKELQQQGISLRFARVNRPLREIMDKRGLRDSLGATDYFPSVHAAVASFLGETERAAPKTKPIDSMEHQT